MSRKSIAIVLALLLVAGASTAQSNSVQDHIMSLNEAAARLDRAGQHDSAFVLADSAVKLAEKELGPDHPVTALSMNSLATLMYDWGRIEKAENLYTRIFKIWKQHPPVDTTLLGAAMYNRGTIKLEKGQRKEAIPILREAADLLKKAAGPQSPYYGNALFTLAEAYRANQECEAAIPLFRQTLEIRAASSAPADLSTAQALNSLGICLVAEDSLAAAEKAYQEALKIATQAKGIDDISVAYCMDNLARLYYRQKRFPEANRLSTLSLETLRARTGNDSREVAQSLLLRGEILLDTEQFQAAIPVLSEADRLLTGMIGPSHQLTREVRLKLATAYAEIGDSVNAAATRARAGGSDETATASPADSN